jgi:hypothetical protein
LGSNRFYWQLLFDFFQKQFENCAHYIRTSSLYLLKTTLMNLKNCSGGLFLTVPTWVEMELDKFWSICACKGESGEQNFPNSMNLSHEFYTSINSLQWFCDSRVYKACLSRILVQGSLLILVGLGCIQDLTQAFQRNFQVWHCILSFFTQAQAAMSITHMGFQDLETHYRVQCRFKCCQHRVESQCCCIWELM